MGRGTHESCHGASWAWSPPSCHTGPFFQQKALERAGLSVDTSTGGRSTRRSLPGGGMRQGWDGNRPSQRNRSRWPRTPRRATGARLVLTLAHELRQSAAVTVWPRPASVAVKVSHGHRGHVSGCRTLLRWSSPYLDGMHRILFAPLGPGDPLSVLIYISGWEVDGWLLVTSLL